MKSEAQPIMEGGEKEKIELTHERFKDLLSLSEEEKALLMQKIIESKGKIRIFVHPFYDYFKREYALADVAELHPETMMTKAIQKVLIDLLERETGTTPPIFIMEEGNMADNLIEEVNNRSESVNNDAYIIKTRPDSSSPIGTLVNGKEVDRDIAWIEIRCTLEELGVTDILLAGMYLNWTRYKDGFDKEINLRSGCAGMAYNHLSEKFNVELSVLTDPRNRLNVNFPNI